MGGNVASKKQLILWLSVIFCLVGCKFEHSDLEQGDSKAAKEKNIDSDTPSDNLITSEPVVVTEPVITPAIPETAIMPALPWGPLPWGGFAGDRGRGQKRHKRHKNQSEDKCLDCCWTSVDNNCQANEACVTINLAAGESSTIVIPSDGTATINYTVKNQTCADFNLVLAPIAGAVQIPSEGGCNFPSVLKAGNSCNLRLLINGASVPPGGIQGGPQVCNAGNPEQCSQPAPQNRLNVSTESNVVDKYIAQATTYTNAMIQPIKPTFPGGFPRWRVRPEVTLAWKFLTKLSKKSGTNIPTTALLQSSSCGMAFNNSTHCAVVGEDGGAPFIMQSYNGGGTWAAVNIPGLPPQGELRGVSCTTNPSGVSTCVAYGVNNSNVSFVVQTVDSGASWSIVNAVDFSQSTLTSVDCTSNAGTTLCQITGSDASIPGPVIFHYTPQAGWQRRDFLMEPYVSSASITYAISCASVSNNDIGCIIGLQNNGSDATLIRTIVDGTGLNYQAFPIINASTQGAAIVIKTTACVEVLDVIYCIAGGNNGTFPFLVQNFDINNDAGWSSLIAAADPGEIIGTSCVESNNMVKCAAAGNKLNAPYIFGTDDGMVWEEKTVFSNPSASGTYNSASCSMSFDQPFCFTAGLDGAGEPISAISNGNGAAWQSASGVSSVFTTEP